MIDIPSGSKPSAAASSVAASAPPDSAGAIVLSKLQAVVEVVKARMESGQPEKPAWDILLKINNQSTATPLRADQVTPDILRALQAGQAVLLQTRASMFVPTGSQLHVSVSAQQGVQIQQLQLPNPAPALQLAQLKQWIPQQQALTPLLSNLQHLLQSRNQQQLAMLPLQLQTAIRQVVAALPDPASVRNPGQLQQLVANSGILQEAKLAQVIQAVAATRATNTADGGGTVPTSTQPLQQLGQQVRSWVQRLTADPDAKVASSTPVGTVPTTAAATQPQSQSVSSTPPQPQPAPGRIDGPHNVLHNDLKQTLQQLEHQLQSANTASKPPAPDARAPAPTPGIATKGATENPGDITNLAARKAGLAPESLRNADGSRAPDQAAATTLKPALAIQRYQSSGAALAGKSPADPNAVPDLIPPLPGQVVVQAQPRTRASLSKGDLADAIVKTLLAQVRGAIARVTLHQLSSQTARQDGPVNTSLSFEIPFLHHGQVELFQFRIDEEKEPQQDTDQKSRGKRWVVQLGFDVEGLGPMFCQLSLSGKSMAVQFWAAWEQTLSSTRAHFDFLEQALQDMGIRVEKIQAQLGMPEVDKTGVRNQLVDIKT